MHVTIQLETFGITTDILLFFIELCPLSIFFTEAWPFRHLLGLLPSSGKVPLDGAILSHKVGRSHVIHGTEQGFGLKIWSKEATWKQQVYKAG
jgi:hypothetical protein